ncbi:MAG TPA: carboxypeptidase-like regulatory domain-containing protein [Terriglobales bacterium]|nr:carboxypeptidase-like regulatory domain-containing protein [Terriglobales bacterium]
MRCCLVAAASATPITAHASCFTELNKIVKTADGRVTSNNGKPIPNAEIVVRSYSGEVVLRTESKLDGIFHLAAQAGKYQVEVRAERHLKFFYIVDLRSTLETGMVEVVLQSNGECHDLRVITEKETNHEDRCASEIVSPNLILKAATVISGRISDETSAPLKESAVWLAKSSGSTLQPQRTLAKTDEQGRFVFDEAEPGSYRLLASPNRGFAQPVGLDCYEQVHCTLDIVLKVNPTGQPYAGCPVQ